MLFRKNKPKFILDLSTQQPAVCKSICTGEMTAGWIDRKTGEFHELMKIDSVEDFRRQTGAENIKIIY